MEKLTAGQKRDALITGCALGASAFLLSVGVADAGIATPLGIVAGMSGALFAVSPWKTRLGDRLRVMPALPVDNAPPVIYENRTPMIEEMPTVNRQPQRTQTLQRRAPVAAGRALTGNIDSKLANQLNAEIEAINSTLQALKVNAGTKPPWTQIGGKQLVFYTIKAGAGQRIEAIEKCLPELSEAISTLRQKQTLVRMLRFPLRLEVEHPFHEPLVWDTAVLDGNPNTVLIGKSFDNGAGNFWASFADAPHMLVSGTTGAGKSVLLNAMALSVAWNTSPADLSIYLIDLKNRSLAPLRSLPHVVRFASDVESACEVVKMAGAALDAKIRDRRTVDNRQHLVIIDEYADLSGNADAMATINHIVRMGREDAVNMVIGTQHPTASVLGKDGTKQNFPMRLVGAVTDPGAAHCASGRGGTGAHLLPIKRGAFLSIQGPEIKRVNTYMLNRADVVDTVRLIRGKWSGVGRPVASAAIDETPTVDRSDDGDEIGTLVEEIRGMWAAGTSKNAMSRAIYGMKFGGSHGIKINSAIAILESEKSSPDVRLASSPDVRLSCNSDETPISDKKGELGILRMNDYRKAG